MSNHTLSGQELPPPNRREPYYHTSTSASLARARLDYILSTQRQRVPNFTDRNMLQFPQYSQSTGNSTQLQPQPLISSENEAPELALMSYHAEDDSLIPTNQENLSTTLPSPFNTIPRLRRPGSSSSNSPRHRTFPFPPHRPRIRNGLELHPTIWPTRKQYFMKIAGSQHGSYSTWLRKGFKFQTSCDEVMRVCHADFRTNLIVVHYKDELWNGQVVEFEPENLSYQDQEVLDYLPIIHSSTESTQGKILNITKPWNQIKCFHSLTDDDEDGFSRMAEDLDDLVDFCPTVNIEKSKDYSWILFRQSRLLGQEDDQFLISIRRKDGYVEGRLGLSLLKAKPVIRAFCDMSANLAGCDKLLMF